MPFIGNQPALSYTSFAVQHFTTSATTSYTLDYSVANENEIRLVINNVVQQPGSSYAYTASGTTLTLSAATSATDTMYAVFLGKAVQTVTPASGTVTGDMLSKPFNYDSGTLYLDDTNNRVGIGTTSPNNKLHLDIGTDNTGLYINSSDGNTGIALADNGGSIVLQNTGSGDFRVLAGGDLNTPGDNSSEKFRVRANGGITFNGDTSGDNALDDYEEGNWTPAAYSGISSLSATEATYVKIGRVVTVYAQCNSFTSKTSSHLRISGLPYTPVTAGRYMQGTAESDGGAVGIARSDGTTGRIIFYRPGSTNSSRQSYLGNQLGSGLRFSLTYFVAT